MSEEQVVQVAADYVLELYEVALWALRQNFHADHMNASIHCAPVRYSPLTFRLAQALGRHSAPVRGNDLGPDNSMIVLVLSDLGAYEPDPGR